jgi:hypothetical protein
MGTFHVKYLDRKTSGKYWFVVGFIDSWQTSLICRRLYKDSQQSSLICRRLYMGSWQTNCDVYITASYGWIRHVSPDLPESLFAVSLHGNFYEYLFTISIMRSFSCIFYLPWDILLLMVNQIFTMAPNILLMENHIAYPCNCATSPDGNFYCDYSLLTSVKDLSN